MPSRVNVLRETIKSLEPQFDEIRIYLNNFDSIPKWLKNYTIATGDDLTDNGKFYFLQFAKDEYYHTCDDDIIYPANYAENCIEGIKKHGTIVTHHGRILIDKDVSYYGGHEFFHCANDQHEERLIDISGTGVTAFDTNYFCPKDIYKSDFKCMSDIVFGYEAKRKGKKITVLPHKVGWIRPQHVEDTIYKKHRHNESLQIHLANKTFDLKKYFD